MSKHALAFVFSPFIFFLAQNKRSRLIYQLASFMLKMRYFVNNNTGYLHSVCKHLNKRIITLIADAKFEADAVQEKT